VQSKLRTVPLLPFGTCTVCAGELRITKLRIIIKLRSSQLARARHANRLHVCRHRTLVEAPGRQVRQQAVQQRTCTRMLSFSPDSGGGHYFFFFGTARIMFYDLHENGPFGLNRLNLLFIPRRQSRRGPLHR
jgi:hypothetical protein